MLDNVRSDYKIKRLVAERQFVAFGHYVNRHRFAAKPDFLFFVNRVHFWVFVHVHRVEAETIVSAAADFNAFQAV